MPKARLSSRQWIRPSKVRDSAILTGLQRHGQMTRSGNVPPTAASDGYQRRAIVTDLLLAALTSYAPARSRQCRRSRMWACWGRASKLGGLSNSGRRRNCWTLRPPYKQRSSNPATSSSKTHQTSLRRECETRRGTRTMTGLLVPAMSPTSTYGRLGSGPPRRPASGPRIRRRSPVGPRNDGIAMIS